MYVAAILDIIVGFVRLYTARNEYLASGTNKEALRRVQEICDDDMSKTMIFFEGKESKMNKTKCCMFCGQKLESDARFCSMCGKLQEDPVIREVNQQVESDIQEVKTNVSAEELETKARTAFADFSQKVKDTNLSDMAKNTAKAAIDSMEQSAKQSRTSKVGKGKKGKKKAQLFEEEIFDGEEAARELYDRNTKKLARCKIGLTVAAIASVIGGTSFITQLGLITLPLFLQNVVDVLLIPAIIGAMVSYVLAGGIVTAMKYSFRIAKFGWFVVPIFPIDVAIGLMALLFSIFAFIYIPIISVGINYTQTKKNIVEAEILFGIIR